MGRESLERNSENVLEHVRKIFLVSRNQLAGQDLDISTVWMANEANL